MLVSSVLAAIEVGPYISPWKLIPLIVIVLVWAKMLAWADKDAVAAHMPRNEINLGLIGGLLAGVAMFFLLPNFWIALVALIGFLAVDIGVYLGIRNAKVGLKDLPAELKEMFSFGSKKEKLVKEVTDQVQFLDPGGKIQPSPGAEDPVRPVFDTLQEALVDPLRRSAETIEVTPAGEDGANVRYVVDGVGYRSKQLDRNTAAAVIALAKKYAAMDVKDRRKPQSGKVKVSVNGKKHELTVNTAGSSAGETMKILVDAKARHGFRLDALGFTARQLEVVTNIIKDGDGGVVLVAAPKSQGLTSTLYGIMRAHDAFIEHLQTIERDPSLDLEGINQNPLPETPPAGEEAKLTSWVVSQQPDVVMVAPLEEQQSAALLIGYAKDKRVYVGLRTTGVTEAIGAWRKLVGDDRLAISQLKMVITGRVIRKLCSACKVAYTPDPATLRKMNMDPEKVTQLYQKRDQPMRNEKGQVIPCTFCNELRFSGRVGVFEVLNVDDDVKAALTANSGSQLKAAFRKQKGKYLQEAALEVVERGETSVQEVLRVLRGPDGSKTAPSEAGAA